MNYKFYYLLTLCLAISMTALAQDGEQLENDNIQITTPKNTTIHFASPVFEYGKIEQGEVVTNVFVLTNSGTEPLIISSAKGSCGCTVPQWPKDPVMPGETAELLVKFNSKGKKGKQSKRVTITANTEPAQTFLTIKGEVTIPDPAVEEVTEQPVIKNNRVDVKTFEVYPNPSSDFININLKDHLGEAANIQLYDATGKLLTAQKLAAVSKEAISLDVSTYPAGIYTVTMKVGDNMRVAKRVAVQR